VAKCRNARALNLVEQMRHVFDHHTDMDRTGMITGGDGKLACVRDVRLDEPIVSALVQTPCKGIIEDFRALFRDFYRAIPTLTDVSLGSSSEADREEDPRVKAAREKLSSSRWVLDMMDGHLSCQWNVDDDGSLHTTVLHPNSVASRDRRKRKAPDSKDDGYENFNQRRKGRLPPLTPANSKLSGGSRWSHRGPHIREGTLSCTNPGPSSRGGDPGPSSNSVPSSGSRLRT
jgi:hypothetical protein